MAGEKLGSIDDYERFVHARLAAWSPQQRTALAAAMAERWLPVYEAFATREKWGDPAHFRRSLEAVWKHISGKPLSTRDVSRYMAQLEDSTPHMDDFDDQAALAACVMLRNALGGCKTDDNVPSTMQAVISGFYAVDPDWDQEPEEQPRLWQQIMVRREYQVQLKLMEEIEAIPQLDDPIIQALRKKLRRKETIGESLPAAETAPGLGTITNQTAFEVYRRSLESDLNRNQRDWWNEDGYTQGSTLWAIMLFSEWSGRYRRRGATINPGFGSSKLADVTAQQALMTRLRAQDREVTGTPDWGAELQQLIDMALKNTPTGFDVNAFDQPHGYGPSLRALWLEAQRIGNPETEIWRTIVTWARHRPEAWEAEDRRKKQGRAFGSPELGVLFARELIWQTTGELEHPWAASVGEEHWQIGLNDFPDDFMFRLVIDAQNVGGFHDWPETWQRA